MPAIVTDQESALRIVRDQIAKATAASKCLKCGCFHSAVNALASTEAGTTQLKDTLNQARGVFQPKEYDCLGCPVCYPAIAANAFSEAFGGRLDLCPTGEPAERTGWPPLPGDYHVTRYKAPVAVCTLNSDSFAARLAELAPVGLAIAGTLHTENLGIERLIRNTLSNPNIRFLIVCGEDTRQSVGHLPGQSLQSLLEHGMDERGRILGARGRRPVLKNVTAEQVEAFRRQVELIAMIGEEGEERILVEVENSQTRTPGPFDGAPGDSGVPVLRAVEPLRLTLDPAGYFVFYPDRAKRHLVVEHYTNAGLLTSIIEGDSPAAICSTLIERELVTRLDHAAYLGRELARAEASLRTAERYVQDRAAGTPMAPRGCRTSTKESKCCE